MDSEEHQLKQYLSSLSTYNQTRKYREGILQENQQMMKVIQNVIANILRQTSSEPLQKLLAVKLAKDCMELYNDEFVSNFQHTVLPLMEKLALLNMESAPELRGRTLFSQNPNETQARIGNSLLKLTLDCLWVWSKWFPVDPETSRLSYYKIALERLVYKNVKFTKLEYFDAKVVEKYMPECSIPIMALQECKNVIAEDLRRTSGEGSTLKIVFNKLYIDTKRELAREGPGQVVFHSDLLRRVMVKEKVEIRRTHQLEDPDQQKSQNQQLASFNEQQTDRQESNQNCDNMTVTQLQQQIISLQKQVERYQIQQRQMQQKIKEQDQEINNLQQKLAKGRELTENDINSRTNIQSPHQLTQYNGQ